MNVAEIVKKYLDDNGFDGLASDECGCSKDDMMPCGCGEAFADCVPGYLCECEHDCGEFNGCYTSEKSKKCWRKEE